MKQNLIYTVGGIGIGLMLAATFAGIERWQVTTGITLLVSSIVLRYFFEK